MYDLIGDIHGYGLKLEALLKKLNYEKINGVYKHPDRKVFFLGDYIDRGPEIPLTLSIVRSMVESGNALAIMGNHELNALAFETEVDGKALRPHTSSNQNQYSATLNQFESDRASLDSYLNWFYTLPLFYESEFFRAIHACWDQEIIKDLSNILVDNKLNESLLINAFDPGHNLFHLVETSLKGKEVDLPSGVTFKDKDGKKRNRIRIKWWLDPENKTLKDLALPYLDSIPDQVLNLNKKQVGSIYFEDQKPVFFGHYWLKGKPIIQSPNVCCLDYSVAKSGYLTCYRYDDEQLLDPSKLVFV